MPVGNLDVVRPIYEAWERGDFSSAEWAHPDIALVLADGPTPFEAKGIAAMAGAWRSVLSAWTEFRVEVEAYRELDEGRVLVLTRNSGRGKTSGVEVEQISTRGANVVHVRDGRVVRLIAYWDREHAFYDLGLPHEPVAER